MTIIINVDLCTLFFHYLITSISHQFNLLLFELIINLMLPHAVKLSYFQSNFQIFFFVVFVKEFIKLGRKEESEILLSTKFL